MERAHRSSYFSAIHRYRLLFFFKGGGIFFSAVAAFIARFSESLYPSSFFVPSEKLSYMFVPLPPFVTD
jgi:hypothetical protein